MSATVATPTASEANRRKSGRTIRRPDLYSQEHHESTILNSVGKRKRQSQHTVVEAQENGIESDPESERSENDNEEDESEEEQTRANQRNQRAKNATAKPAPKRTKLTNGSGTTLAIRSANTTGKTATKVAKQKARARPSQMHASGLYAEVFGQGQDAEEAATAWHDTMEKDNVVGIRDLVNFIFQCIGCDSRIDSPDIEDIDNVPNKLGDILNEYATQKQSDYPLSSKHKQYHGTKEVLVEFFGAVVRSLHNSGTLYDEPAVYDNIHIWTATMSGAGYRSFRHTATVISLSISTALCAIARELQESMAATKTQLETEKKKKNANKSRVSKLQNDMNRDEKRLEFVDAQLRDSFDTVYIHRYRDVDEKIRVECVTALGGWILNYRKMFLEGQYLRYLGWVLSDPNAPTRHEVIRQLKALYKQKQNIAALRAFTERFRSRIVEMGARDADTNVRVETIELLDRLRNAELLEPDDIDVIGQLIFDNEPRIRRAVAKFFVSNIEDLYGAMIEDFDKEQFNEILPAKQKQDDFDDPSQAWIKFKCLAQTLGTQHKDAAQSSGKRSPGVYGTEEIDSRYMLATQSIYPFMLELQQWESLAGYLLYDHSAIPTKTKKNDLASQIQAAYKLESGEETVLLDVLFYSVKLTLQDIIDSKHDQKSKQSIKAKNESRKKQEAAAHYLTTVIPQLLNKFGNTPEAATSILRLEQLLNADLIDDLQSGEGSYASLLDDINKQFVSHSDRKVLAEASRALRAARSYENSKEAADAKVAEMWAEASQNLVSLLSGKNTSARGTLDRNALRQLVETMSRLAQLASVSDCTEVLENKMNWPSTKASRARKDSMLEVFLQLVRRGVPDDDTPKQFVELEDRLCGFVITVLSLYYRWKVVNLKKAISANDKRALSTAQLTSLAMKKSEFAESILPVITDRQPLDPVRVNAILTMMDLFTLFATVKHMRSAKGGLDEAIQTNLNSLLTEVNGAAMKAVMETHEKMEKKLAKRAKKKIDLTAGNLKNANQSGKGQLENEGQGQNDEDVEKPPEDSDDENERGEDSSSDEDENEDTEVRGTGKDARKHSALLAEQGLCEMTSKVVLGIIAAVVPKSAEVKARLQVNRTKLGKSYTQVIAYLDEKKEKGKPKPKTPIASPATLKQGTSKKTAQKSDAMILPQDDIEDDEDGEAGAEDDDPDALREQGLDDDPIEEDDAENEGAAIANEDEDEIMGD